MGAYYNEHDPKAAAWLRELIAAGHLPAGEVDERSIVDVRPADLAGFRQCHFFAGIGGWPYALRLAGWPDDRPVWTGSCPCPPFSAAGKGSECPSCGGKHALSHPLVTAGWVCLDCGDEWRGDDRHLVPEFLRLIGERQAPVVFGEQVASASGRVWFAAVRAVLEKLGNAVGAADLCAAGVGAPHIRQRLFFGAARLADAMRAGRPKGRPLAGNRQTAGGGGAGRLADAECPAVERQRSDGGEAGRLGNPERLGAGRHTGAGAGAQGRAELRPERDDAGSSGAVRRLADVDGERQPRRPESHLGPIEPGQQTSRRNHALRCGADDRPRPHHVDWRDADWLFCRDGRWRPVEPGTFPLAHGLPARVGRLRGYGNAIVPQLAATFVTSFAAALSDQRAAA